MNPYLLVVILLYPCVRFYGLLWTIVRKVISFSWCAVIVATIIHIFIIAVFVIIAVVPIILLIIFVIVVVVLVEGIVYVQLWWIKRVNVVLVI